MKKSILSLFAALMTVMAVAAPKTYTLTSPDGKVVATVSAGNEIAYSVAFDGAEVLSPSVVSMTLADGSAYNGKVKFQKALKASVDETADALVYKKSRVRNHYNQLTLRYKTFDLVFRAYDQGVAYRFVSRSKRPFTVKSEQASFNFAEDFTAYVPYVRLYDQEDNGYDSQFTNSFENFYERHPLSAWQKGRIAFLPVAVKGPGETFVCITESDLLNYPGMFLENKGGKSALEGVFAPYPKDVEQGGHNMLQGLVRSRENFIAKAGAAEQFPWRIISVTASEVGMLDNDMVFNLSRPAENLDWSWVKPGKVAWDWWNDWNIRGVDFEAGVNTATYKSYIDFAAAHGIEYVIMDEGWAVNGVADLFRVIPEIDLQGIIDYGKSKNVGIILWAGYWAVNRDIEGVCRHFADMGVKGFKIDFMDRDDQPMVQFYTEVARTAAKYHLMVDFHGAFKPSGLMRPYPNVINYEGVNGLEQMKWEKETRHPEYDVTIPFIRMVAGPFDYTQGAMRNAVKSNYFPCYTEPMSQGTRCHQLAEYVIFEAPFTMLCDSPSNYEKEEECTGFISSVPTTWEETVPLAGKVGEYAAIARRSGSDWYVGAITNWDARDLSLDLNFLPAGNYRVEIFRDGANAHRAGSDYVREVKKISVDGSAVKIHLAPGGGWVARISK